MKVNEILCEATTNEVAIIFGRFNPPHKGHRAAWELASESPLWFVGTNKSTVGAKDPLPFDVKIKAMEAIWPKVRGHIMAETSWLTMASKVYSMYGDVTLLCLTDEDWVTKTIQQYNGKEAAHGYYNFKVIKQKPTPRLSSATALRDAVMKNDRLAFADAAGVSADMLVDGKPFFDLVAEYLLPYVNTPKKAAKKKVKEAGGRKLITRKLQDIAARKAREQEAAKRAEVERKDKEAKKANNTTDNVSEMGGSGVIASKKQAKDLRYSTSLTKDVKPGAISKNLRALGLAK